MAFGVIFVLLIVVSGWWLYSRWSDVRESESRRREAEMMFIFEAQSKSKVAASAVVIEPGRTGEFHTTLPGDR